MRIELPILHQEIAGEELISKETTVQFDLDTSVYSEERWEQNFPNMAAHEGLFQYIERVQKNSLTERVKVAAMLKAIFCFLESDEIRSYKSFAQMFNLANSEYTEKLISALITAFKLVLRSSSVKN